MHSQFTKKFVNIIYLSYNDNVIVIRKRRRAKNHLKYSLNTLRYYLSFAVILKRINLFPSHLKSFLKDFINFYRYYYSFSLRIFKRPSYLIKNNLI